MFIKFNEENQTFHLSNQFISYEIAVEEEKYLAQHYFGKKINEVRTKVEYPRRDRGFGPVPNEISHREFSLHNLLQEYPGADIGDFREPAYKYEDTDGWTANSLIYDNYSIFEGKPSLKGLPQTYLTNNNQAQTLVIHLKDNINNLKVNLLYTLFKNLPVITRSVEFENASTSSVTLDRALSFSIDFPHSDYDLIQLPGAWVREREVVRTPLVKGIHTIDSKQGTTSHNYQPFIGLADDTTTESMGEAYGFHLIYSGEFIGNVEVDIYNQTRIQMGINPYHFKWQLKPGESFQTPEAVMVYSDQGLNGLSQAFHELYQNHLVRGEHQYKERPVLINNWEGTYFDFNEEKILEMVDEAADLGVELFVLDDGWFGKRDDDYSSLGDWQIYKDKLPNGLKSLSEAIHSKGMKFGLWFEPEMISEDSHLYREHPEWAIHTPGRKPSRSRSQLVLDFSRKEVRDNILKQMKAILDEVPIDYIKWDYNRNMTELGSAAPGINPGEVAHRYILGLYEVMEELVTSYPNILFESCSGGGGRYDPGLLYYMPQTWTSDNTDAASRLEIQYGTSLVFPISSMGAHVSSVPNHQVNRYTSLKMRGDVASSGNLGYELDVTTLNEEEKDVVKEQINFYKEHRALVQYGTFYRILSPFEGNDTSWIFVDSKKENALFYYYQIKDKANKANKRIKMTGLDENKVYELDEGRVFGGDELMYKGFYIDPDLIGDYKSRRFVLKELK